MGLDNSRDPTIYATLALAGIIAGRVNNDDLSAAVFVIGLILVGIAVAAFAFGARPRGMEIGVAFGVAAVYLMLLLRMSLEERTHLFEYGVVGALIYEALRERVSGGRHVPYPAVTAVGATIAVGAVDEGIQAMLPNRVFDVQDIGFNALAGIAAVASVIALRWGRSWRGGRRPPP